MWTVIGAGVITFCVSLPLIYGKVPMNHLYGIRIPESFVSAERWYDINAYGGLLLARWSCVIVATGIAGFFVPFHLFERYEFISAGVVLISVVAPLIQIVRWAAATRRP